MQIHQFFDKPLAHASYALISEGDMAVVDPGRDPQPYYDYATAHNAKIRLVIETHPHADFVSSHLQIHQERGATIITSDLTGAEYPHKGVKDLEEFTLGQVVFKTLHTPGHSPDSISLVATDKSSGKKAVFTGDTLFIGDVGRPDLRESAGKMRAKRESLARDMYQTLHNKFMGMDDDTTVYPAHGAGSLCGKNMSDETVSTIGKEKEQNWALQDMTEDAFVDELLNEQPFVPKYFSYDVELNKNGAASYAGSIESVKQLGEKEEISAGALVVDTRDEAAFKKGHHPRAINIMISEGDKFETWLGSIISPDEAFYIISGSEEQQKTAIQRSAKIGYEALIEGAKIEATSGDSVGQELDVQQFKEQPEAYTIIDIRNRSEVKENKIFDSAINIPLHELRERADEVATNKPVVVHCAGGYRSAAGYSILAEKMSRTEVYDLSDRVKDFKKD